MKKNKKLILNTYTALLYQAITMICGFILPGYIIQSFGSATNGLINSINQFLAIITLCECGVGAVVQSALYKPLAEKNNEQISKIFISSNNFFKLIMKILIGYVLLLIIIYPFFINDNYSFNWGYIASLIIILAFSYIAQYYLFLTHRLLLNADQASYIQLGVHSIVLILNTIFTIILIKLGANIHIVKIESAVCFLIQPIFLKLYVDKYYKIDYKIKLNEEPIKQKWNGIAQHIASVILLNTDTVVLTLFSTLENVSIYGVYYIVVYGVRQIIVSFSTGIQSLFGNLLVKEQKEDVNIVFNRVEIVFHFLVNFMFIMTGLLIIPFIKIYTTNFNDLNYIYPFFGILMVIAQALYSLRIPYEAITKAKGHYKETQTSSFIEAILNVTTSIILVSILPSSYSLAGVAIGTIIAMTYRTIYLVFYLSKNILYRSKIYFFKNITINIIGIILVLIFVKNIPSINADSYIEWGLMAGLYGIIIGIILTLIYTIVYKREFFRAFKMFFK